MQSPERTRGSSDFNINGNVTSSRTGTPAYVSIIILLAIPCLQTHNNKNMDMLW